MFALFVSEKKKTIEEILCSCSWCMQTFASSAQWRARNEIVSSIEHSSQPPFICHWKRNWRQEHARARDQFQSCWKQLATIQQCTLVNVWQNHKNNYYPQYYWPVRGDLRVASSNPSVSVVNVKSFGRDNWFCGILCTTRITIKILLQLIEFVTK